MEFRDKYISTSENSTTPNPKKILLSDDAYAVGEMISELIKEIDKEGGV